MKLIVRPKQLQEAIEKIKPILKTPNLRSKTLPEQAKYILDNENAFITHPILTNSVSKNPELQRIAERIIDTKGKIPLYKFPSGIEVPLIQSATGENVSLPAFLKAISSGIETPRLIVLKGIGPVTGTGGMIGKGGIEDLITRNKYFFTTNSRRNASEYAWLGDYLENIDRLADYGIKESIQNNYYMPLLDVIDGFNKMYGVKNYAYPNFANTSVLPMYRDTGKPVSFSLHTHLSKKPNGKLVDWQNEKTGNLSLYEEIMDRLSQFWGKEVNGGGVKEILIPRKRAVRIGSREIPILSYRDLKGHSYIDLRNKTLGKLSNNVKDMDSLENWARERKIPSLEVGPVYDPQASVSQLDNQSAIIIAGKKGGKL